MHRTDGSDTDMGALHNPLFWRGVIVNMIALLLSIAVHEFGHAIVADRLGDDTPRRQGRVTLNPLTHADPIGTLVVPFLFMIVSGTATPGFGWGRPVEVTPTRFTRKLRMRTAHLLVAAAGPAMNLLFGTLICAGVGVALRAGWQPRHAAEMYRDLMDVVFLNYILAFFNLIPVPPLDGGAVLAGLLPAGREKVMAALNQWALLILAVCMFTRVAVLFMWPAEHLFQGVSALVLGGA